MRTEEGGRDRVLREARALFLERGYADVSMQQIADAAGLRKASIYHQFRDKQDLFAQVILLEMRRFRQVMERHAAGGFAAQCEALAFAQFEQVQSDVVGLIRDFRLHVPEDRHDEVHRELERLLAVYTGVFEQAAARGELCGVAPRVASLFFFHMVMAWSMHALDDPSLLPPDPRAAARTVTSVLLHGVAAPPPGALTKPGTVATMGRESPDEPPSPSAPARTE